MAILQRWTTSTRTKTLTNWTQRRIERLSHHFSGISWRGGLILSCIHVLNLLFLLSWQPTLAMLIMLLLSCFTSSSRPCTSDAFTASQNSNHEDLSGCITESRPVDVFVDWMIYLIQPLIIGHPKKERIVFQPSFFRGYVSFRESRHCPL